MLDTEGHWSEALTSNNIRAIIRWLQKLPADGTLGASDYLKSSNRSRSSCPYFQKHSSMTAFCVWLTNIYAAGDTDVEEILLTFSCWVQRTSEFAKKELLTLCMIMFFHQSCLNVWILKYTLISARLPTGFSRCRGLWMFLNRSSFTRINMLLQRLKNLLSLAQWARRQLSSPHLWHGTYFRTHTGHSWVKWLGW